MPQTVEAINHAKAAGVPIIVAVNKIDKPGANPDKVRQELTEYGVIPEEWGGQNMFVNISAKKKQGIDELLESVPLQAEIMELKANPARCSPPATCSRASSTAAAAPWPRSWSAAAPCTWATPWWRACPTAASAPSTTPRATPSPRPAPPTRSRSLGLSSVPNAGDEFAEDREARDLADQRALKARIEEQNRVKHVTLENLFDTMADADVKELNLIIKADVQGSIEALQDSLDKMDQSEVRINTIHSAVGAINETDVVLADASNAIIIGFGVRPDAKARGAAERAGVKYSLLRRHLQGPRGPRRRPHRHAQATEVEVSTGLAVVLDTFKVPKVGIAAGVRVEEGGIPLNSATPCASCVTASWSTTARSASMRHYSDEAKSLRGGMEGGIGLENFQDISLATETEAYRIDQVARTE